MTPVRRAAPDTALHLNVAGIAFQNPLLLAAGTAAYGRELVNVMELEAVGGLVTKAVSLRPRPGAPSPRVAEFPGGMINAVGLANPGLQDVRQHDMPWLAEHVRPARVLVNIVGDAPEEYADVVAGLDDVDVVDGFELNVSCPNVKAGGMEFGADPDTLADVVRGARAATARPIFVKLSPMLPDIALSARVAVDAGADGLTLINTIPGLVVDVDRRRPVLGFGSGGVSGPGLLPVGVLATWRVHQAVSVPLIGVGGVSSAHDALQYMIAGASLVGIGTAALRNPRLPGQIVRDLLHWCTAHDVASLGSVVGTLESPR
ncbi:MAG TPA: dihydroorotate dehydrogenase [Gemmatimonadaceae bacterium]|nr:dihydroorotate dehydrogenase [Gemmatimonadaceae bacterium]